MARSYTDASCLSTGAGGVCDMLPDTTGRGSVQDAFPRWSMGTISRDVLPTTVATAQVRTIGTHPTRRWFLCAADEPGVGCLQRRGARRILLGACHAPLRKRETSSLFIGQAPLRQAGFLLALLVAPKTRQKKGKAVSVMHRRLSQAGKEMTNGSGLTPARRNEGSGTVRRSILLQTTSEGHRGPVEGASCLSAASFCPAGCAPRRPGSSQRQGCPFF